MFDLVIRVCVWQIKILHAFVFWFLHCFIKKILESLQHRLCVCVCVFACVPHLVPTCVCEQEVGVGEEVRGRWMFPVKVTAPDRYFILHKLPQLSLISRSVLIITPSLLLSFSHTLSRGISRVRSDERRWFGDYQRCEKGFIWLTLRLYTNLREERRCRCKWNRWWWEMKPRGNM